MSRATDLFSTERDRQVSEEGYTPEHDKGHEAALLHASAAYTTNTAQILTGMPHIISGRANWDEHDWPWHPSFWKPTGDAKLDLVKAGALLAAALDALLDADDTAKEAIS